MLEHHSIVIVLLLHTTFTQMNPFAKLLFWAWRFLVQTNPGSFKVKIVKLKCMVKQHMNFMNKDFHSFDNGFNSHAHVYLSKNKLYTRYAM